MDQSQRYSIPFRGLKNGVHDFRFEIDGALFESFGSTEILRGACTADVRLDRSESRMVVDVAIRGSVVVACDRCLEDCNVEIDFDGQFVVKFSDEEREWDGEVLWLLPGEEEIDLAQYLYESVVLSLPYQRVHPEGQCDPAMLERFRIVSGEEFASIEAEAAHGESRGGEWEKLAALRAQMESGEGGEESAGTDSEEEKIDTLNL